MPWCVTRGTLALLSFTPETPLFLRHHENSCKSARKPRGNTNHFRATRSGPYSCIRRVVFVAPKAPLSQRDFRSGQGYPFRSECIGRSREVVFFPGDHLVLRRVWPLPQLAGPVSQRGKDSPSPAPPGPGRRAPPAGRAAAAPPAVGPLTALLLRSPRSKRRPGHPPPAWTLAACR